MRQITRWFPLDWFPFLDYVLYIGCHFHMLFVAIADVVRCNYLCCLLQLPMLSVAIAYVVSCNCRCNCLCCQLQFMLSVAIAYVVCCNCLCCPFDCLCCQLQLPMLSFEFKNVHTMCIPISTTTALNPKPWTPPPSCAQHQKQKPKNLRGLLQWCGVVLTLTPRGSVWM